jgi:hypothetical protein
MAQPHFVRFAQALALVTGLAGVTTGCSGTTTAGTDSGNGAIDSGNGTDAAMIADAAGGTDAGGETDAGTAVDAASADDSGNVADAGAFDCSTCDCGFLAGDSGVPLCTGDAIITCGCAAVGPLAPPDLAV